MIILSNIATGCDGCAGFDEGLYTESEVDDLINISGYIPVATMDEIALIEGGGSQTMGTGTCWEDAYTVGVGQKYVQVKNIDATAYGTWSNGIDSFTGTFDGAELSITNLTQTMGLWLTCLSGYSVKNMRVSGSYSRLGQIQSPYILSSEDGEALNNHYTGAIDSSNPVTDKNLGGIIGEVTVHAGTLTVSNNVVTSAITTGNGNYVGGILGNAVSAGASSTLIMDGNTFNTSIVAGTTSSSQVGGCIGDGINVTITNFTNNADITGFTQNVGGVAGRIRSQGTIEDCVNTGDVIGGNQIAGIIGSTATTPTLIVRRCSNTGDIEATTVLTNPAGAGGIVGVPNGGIASSVNTTTIEDCFNTGTITGSYYLGGIIAASAATILRCYNLGNLVSDQRIVGGIIGAFYAGSINDCYSWGNINTESLTQGGGIIGFETGSGTVDNCYAACTSTGAGGFGGVCGQGTPTVTDSYWDTDIGPATSAGGTGKTTAELQTPTSATGIYVNWTDPAWDFGTASDYPELT